jgi:predicted AAA+ superfamily ATPase
VVSEVLKHRTNQGERGGLFFYRDRRGTEADLVVESGRRRILVEAKAGRTAAEDVLSVARQIRTTLGEVAQGDPPQREAGRAVVVYGGQARQARSDVLVLPWDELDRESWFL